MSRSPGTHPARGTPSHRCLCTEQLPRCRYQTMGLPRDLRGTQEAQTRPSAQPSPQAAPLPGKALTWTRRCWSARNAELPPPSLLSQRHRNSAPRPGRPPAPMGAEPAAPRPALPARKCRVWLRPGAGSDSQLLPKSIRPLRVSAGPFPALPCRCHAGQHHALRPAPSTAGQNLPLAPGGCPRVVQVQGGAAAPRARSGVGPCPRHPLAAPQCRRRLRSTLLARAGKGRHEGLRGAEAGAGEKCCHAGTPGPSFGSGTTGDLVLPTP